jgi:tripartite ATP-independent transporter DctM subunit
VSATPEAEAAAAPPPAGPSRPLSIAVRAENALSVALLSAMALLPLVEMAGRRLWGTGIPGSSDLVQHATLWVGFLGGAIAARDGRLLSLGRAAGRLPPKFREAAVIFYSAVSTAVCALLGWAGFLMAQAEYQGGADLMPGLPLWAAEAVIPAGFALIAWRMARASSGGWTGRAACVACAALIVALVLSGAVFHPAVLVACLAVLLASVVLGAPLFVALAGLALLLFRHEDVTLAAIPVEIYRRITAPTLPTIPLFTFAGYLLTAGRSSIRLVRFFRSLVGWMPGAIAVATVLVCTFFTTFTGASGVTILALGGMLLPALVAEGYPEKFSLGLVTSSGSLGLLFPPCLPVILYGVIAGIAVDKMFLGGFLPGLLLVAGMLALALRTGIRSGARRTAFSLDELRSAAWAAKWDLLLPVIVLAGIFGGFATTVEAAAMAALYAFFVEFVIHREISLSHAFVAVGTESATLIGGVLVVLAAATGLTGYMVDAGVPSAALAWVRDTIHSPLLFLLVLNVFLLLVGCLMDIFSAIVVVVPIIAPMAAAFGIHPVHLGIIFLANLELGFLNPPVGMNLFLSAYRFNRTLGEVYRANLPFYLILLIGVLAITYLPALTTALLP